jgi:L-threonylcarbamoyladenylate synthase
MPGPLTLLLPKNELIPDFVTSGLPDVAIRIPAHPVTAKLLSLLNYPVAAPSANPFGYISPTNALHVFEQMNSKIPYILDGGQCNEGIESTIVGFKQGAVVVYRAGSVTIGAIESLIGKVTLNTDTRKVVAPGMFRKHYSPHTPLIVTDDLDEAVAGNTGKKIGFITYDSYHPDYPTDHQILLGRSVRMTEVAHNLYSAMHKMDASGFDLIIVKKLPETDLGIAINEKLYRAAVI